MAQVTHRSAMIVGGGQAGLSMSACLAHRGIDHLVIEKRTALHTWRTERWDSFCLVTPNWQCRLPGHSYEGGDPHGFMKKNEIIVYLDAFRAKVRAPILEGTVVQRAVRRPTGGFTVATSNGTYTTDQLVVATGGYHKPIIPRMAERLPRTLVQIHSVEYRNAAALPEGRILVVGSGQSGAQIAEDLHLAGREVLLAVGEAPRCARFYRGRDVVDWLADMGYYDMPVDDHPLREGVRDNTNHYVTGRDGGRDIDLRRFALEGMQLYGRLIDADEHTLRFAPTLASALDAADAVYNGINASIDKYITAAGITAPPGARYLPRWTPEAERTELALRESGISAVIWCIGYTADFTWLDVPVFNGRGQPQHKRGVTREPGLYFLGLPWLHTWGSGRFSGVADDARYLAGQIELHRAVLDAPPQAVPAGYEQAQA